jgi:hypothetical protein
MVVKMVVKMVGQRADKSVAEMVDLWDDQWADLWGEKLVAMTAVLMVGKTVYELVDSKAAERVE